MGNNLTGKTQKDYAKTYYYRHTDKIKENSKKYYNKNKKKIAKRQAEWYKEHKEYHRQKTKEYYEYVEDSPRLFRIYIREILEEYEKNREE